MRCVWHHVNHTNDRSSKLAIDVVFGILREPFSDEQYGYPIVKVIKLPYRLVAHYITYIAR